MFKKIGDFLSGHVVGDTSEKGDASCEFLKQQADALPGAPLPFLFVSLHESNIIRYGPRVNDAVTATIKHAIESLDIGVIEFGDFRGVVQWKLTSNLFDMDFGSYWVNNDLQEKSLFGGYSYVEGKHETHVKSIRLINRVIEGLRAIGWHLQIFAETAGSVINRDGDGPQHCAAKSTLCFHYTPMSVSAPSPPRRLMSIEAHSKNRILLVDGPPMAAEIVKQCIERVYTFGFTQKEEERTPFNDVNGVGGLEFVLHNNPIGCSRSTKETLHMIQLLMAEIILRLEECGFVQLGLFARNSHPGQRPTMIFEYDALLDSPATDTSTSAAVANTFKPTSSEISYVDMKGGGLLTVFPPQSPLDEIVHEVAEMTNGYRVLKEKVADNGTHELMLKGHPFCATFTYSDHCALLHFFLRLVSECERKQLRLLGHARPLNWFRVQISSALYFIPSDQSIEADYLAVCACSDRLSISRVGALFVDIEAIVEECVRLCWPKGVQRKEGDIRSEDSCAYKLKGYLFSHKDGTEEASILCPLFFTVLVSKILESSQSIECLGAFHLSKSVSSRDSLPEMLTLQQTDGLGGSHPPFMFVSLQSVNIIRYGPKIDDTTTRTIENILESLGLDVRDATTVHGVFQWILREEIFFNEFATEDKTIDDSTTGHELRVKSIRLILKIIDKLRTYGWQLHATPETFATSIAGTATSNTDKFAHFAAKSTLCFIYKAIDSGLASSRRSFALQAYENDRLLLVDAPPMIADRVKRVIERVYPHELFEDAKQKSERNDASGSGGYEFVLGGNPFEEGKLALECAADLFMAETLRVFDELDIHQVGLITGNSESSQRPMMLFAYSDVAASASVAFSSTSSLASVDRSVFESPCSYFQMSDNNKFIVFPSMHSTIRAALNDALNREVNPPPLTPFRDPRPGRAPFRVKSRSDGALSIFTLTGADTFASFNDAAIHCTFMRLCLRLIAYCAKNGIHLIGQSRHKQCLSHQTPATLYFSPSSASIDADYMAITPISDRLNVTRIGSLMVDINTIVEESVKMCWPRGIQRVDGDIAGEDAFCSYKLKGYLFSSNESAENIESTCNPLLITHIIWMILEANASIECIGSFQLNSFSSAGASIWFRLEEGRDTLNNDK